MHKNVSFLLLAVLMLLAGGPHAWATSKPVLHQCLQRASLSKGEASSHHSYDLGGGNRLSLVSADNVGTVCLVQRTAEGDKLLDSRTGLDEIGAFGDFSGTGLMKIGGRVFLRTEQFFRGGSNAIRDYYILYEVQHRKIQQVLRLPKYLGLVINNDVFSEKNTISADKGLLQVHSVLALNKDVGDTEKVQLYKTTRDFHMKYLDEYSSFLDGTAVCTQDFYLDNGPKPWCHKDESLGYVINPQFAENGGGFRLDLVKTGGRQWGSIDDVGLLANLTLKPIEASGATSASGAKIQGGGGP